MDWFYCSTRFAWPMKSSSPVESWCPCLGWGMGGLWWSCEKFRTFRRTLGEEIKKFPRHHTEFVQGHYTVHIHAWSVASGTGRASGDWRWQQQRYPEHARCVIPWHHWNISRIIKRIVCHFPNSKCVLKRGKDKQCSLGNTVNCLADLSHDTCHQNENKFPQKDSE